MLTSKEVLERSGISRATLNNYISMGIIPRPQVRRPGPEGGRARQLGYFEDEVLDRLKEVRRLKDEGLDMAAIAAQLGGEYARAETKKREAAESASTQSRITPSVPDRQPLRLTIDEIPYPAYMTNYNFQVTWYNEQARSKLLGGFDQLPLNMESRSVFPLLVNGAYCTNRQHCTRLLQFHIALAKERLPKSTLLGRCHAFSSAMLDTLESLYDDTEATRQRTIVDLRLDLDTPDGEVLPVQAFASFYREGILFVYVPRESPADELVDLLGRRDEVIRHLLRQRVPALTPVATLVADLQESTRICSELPPHEYFDLINQIWATMGPIFRRYQGTQGKHVGDGMLYYFFPQPDSNYVFNALLCAEEIREAMKNISTHWQMKKNWTNELFLNIGLNEGQEWFGTFQSATNVEFAVLGETINHASRLSDYARYGAVWATKNFIGQLAPAERDRVKFGIRRRVQPDREIFIDSTYSSLTSLLDLSREKYEKMRDIAAIPITEVVSVETEE